jgi:hypothetical protein
VTFTSSLKAEKALTTEDSIEKVGVNDDGFGVYRIHFDN